MKRSHIVTLTLLLALASPAMAEPPALMPVQGYLTDSAGAALDGTTAVTFNLYSQEEDGDAVFTETLDVDVADGHFTVYLGDTATLSPAVFRDEQIWLGIAIGADPEATPRIELASVPYALASLYCADADTVGGKGASDFAAASHRHDASSIDGLPADTNAGTLCDSGQYLDGDGTCQTVSNVSDTNAGTLCADGNYLDGDGTCKDIVATVEANALNNESELTALLDDNYADSGHTHSGFASSGHNHDSDYAGTGHTHSGYATTGHNHSGVYAPSNHNHDSDYASTSHNHAGVYAPNSHNHSGADITSGTIAYARMGADSSGTCGSGTVCGGGHTHPTNQITNSTTNSGVLFHGCYWDLDTNTNAQTYVWGVCDAGYYPVTGACYSGDGSSAVIRQGPQTSGASTLPDNSAPTAAAQWWCYFGTSVVGHAVRTLCCRY